MRSPIKCSQFTKEAKQRIEKLELSYRRRPAPFGPPPTLPRPLPPLRRLQRPHTGSRREHLHGPPTVARHGAAPRTIARAAQLRFLRHRRPVEAGGPGQAVSRR